MLQSQVAEVKPSLVVGGYAPGNRADRRLARSVDQARLAELLIWYDGRVGLLDGLRRVPDGRDSARTRIPLPAVLLSIMGMFWMDLGSIRALEDRLETSAGLRRLLRPTGFEGTISDDTFADALQGLGWDALRRVLHSQGSREVLRFKTGPHLNSELGQRVKPTGASWLAAQPVVAVDGHEVFFSERRCCGHCLVRKVDRTLPDGTKTKVKQYYHRVVTAQLVGVHPAVFLDVEVQLPGENELPPAYRLVERLGDVYGDSLGIVVADAMFDGGPFRKAVRKAGYHYVIRQKDKGKEPGRTARRQLSKRDPNRSSPDQRYRESAYRRYACWEVEIPEGANRYVEVKREGKGAEALQGALITSLPADKAPMVAVAMVFEMRWWTENTGFRQLVTEWSLDRAFVHAGRPTAAGAIVVLALLAYNAFQAFVYKHLKWPPGALPRALKALQVDFLVTLDQGARRRQARAP